MANPRTTAGGKFYIGGVKEPSSTDFVLADFESVSPAISWTEVDGLINLGSFGDAAEVVTTQLINRGRDFKQKGTRNAGTMTLQFALMKGDAGQAAVLAAELTEGNYAIKVEINDKAASPASPAPTNSLRYFSGLIAQAREVYDTANSIMRLDVTVEINSNIVKKAGTP